MNTKQTTSGAFLSACLVVFLTAGLFATSAMASTDSLNSDMSADLPADSGRSDMSDEIPADLPADSGHSDTPVEIPADLSAVSFRALQAGAEAVAANPKGPMSIIHESAEILSYEDGSPYIHDILTNNTDRAIVETQYCMLAYDEKGSPLALDWNFLDSSAESSFENIVRSKESLLSGQTQDYRGGWSLYDGEIMESFPEAGNGGANQAAYSLFCLKQVVFEDGSVWNNPGYEGWLETYAGRETGTEELQNYYPHEYEIKLD